ncbi:MAG: hypothetical protein M3O70_02340 [Actinomycetota bacterium]|nr:hypothetical protein [Actinomycetota bacterium]
MRYTRSRPSRPARVVLVDPDPHLLQLFSREHPDLNVETVETLEELQSALDGHADLVVVDLEDPLLAHVLADGAHPRTVVTARAGIRTGAEFDGVLHRPYTARDVRRTIRGMLGLPTEPVFDPARWLDVARRSLPWLRVAAAAGAVAATAAQEPALAAWVLLIVLVVTVAERVSQVRPWLAVAADVVTAAVAIGVTGGPASGFVAFGLTVAALAGFKLQPSPAVLAGSALSLGSIGGWLSGPGPAVSASQLASFTIVFPTIALTVAFARRLWPTPHAAPVGQLAQANRAFRGLQRVAAQAPRLLSTAGVAASALEGLHRLPGVLGAVVALEDGGRLYEVAAEGVLDHDPIVLDAARTGRVFGNQELPTSVRRAAPPEAHWSTLPLRVDGRVTGALLVACRARPSRRIRAAFADLAVDTALALEDARVFERLRELAADEERLQFAETLHRGPAQTLTHVQLELDLAALQPPEPEDLARLAASVRHAQGEVRAVMSRLRATGGGVGLPTALRDHCRNLATITRPAIHVDAQPVPRLGADRERALFAVVRDVVDQALRSRGTERIEVDVSASADTVLVLVTNRGGDTSRVNHPAGGLGLPHLRAQAARLGATVDLLAAQGVGYRVAVSCPVEVEVGA